MFIEQYRLEHNPFAEDRVRPFFSSHSTRYATTRVSQLLSNQIHCLCLSGPAGIGKTRLIEQQLRGVKRADISWVESAIEELGDFLHKLTKELGPGAVEGSPVELRNILDVYLRHQAGQGRRTLIVIDALETQSPEVLREIEAMSRARLRGRGVVQLVLLTRNEDLANGFIRQHDGGPLARGLHQRLTGFTLEETTAYIRTCLQGIGCDWHAELFPPEISVEVQAFTQGVVGNIDALCRDALDILAARARGNDDQPRLTASIIREAGTRLHLKYDPAAWRIPQEEALSADAVRLSDHGKLRIEAARLVVSSGGRPVAEISLNRPRMVLGRDASCDISLESTFVSRYQNLFMETTDGWMLIDLNSTNGCFVNGRRVREHHLRDGDLISVGQHQLRFAGPTSGTPEPTERTRSVRVADDPRLRSVR